MDLDGVGKLLVIVGASVLALGLLLVVAARTGWLGGLLQAGTVRFEGGGMACLVPIAASILISIVLTIVLNLLIRFLNR
jgi:hypothetical protein